MKLEDIEEIVEVLDRTRYQVSVAFGYDINVQVDSFIQRFKDNLYRKVQQ